MATDRKRVRMGQVVSIRFSMTVDGGEQHRVDDELAVYLHGHGNVVPGLERALEGHAKGDVIDVVIPPEDGYGPRKKGGLRRIPRSSLAKDLETTVGTQVVMHSADGDVRSLWITGVEGEDVLMDESHPLAGLTLRYRVEVVAVREAHVDELLHGHAHPPPS